MNDKLEEMIDDERAYRRWLAKQPREHVFSVVQAGLLYELQCWKWGTTTAKIRLYHALNSLAPYQLRQMAVVNHLNLGDEDWKRACEAELYG